MVSPTDEIGPIFGHFIHLATSGGLPVAMREGLLTLKSRSANQNLTPHPTTLLRAMHQLIQKTEIQQLRKDASENVPSEIAALLNSSTQRKICGPFLEQAAGGDEDNILTLVHGLFTGRFQAQIAAFFGIFSVV